MWTLMIHSTTCKLVKVDPGQIIKRCQRNVDRILKKRTSPGFRSSIPGPNDRFSSSCAVRASRSRHMFGSCQDSLTSWCQGRISSSLFTDASGIGTPAETVGGCPKSAERAGPRRSRNASKKTGLLSGSFTTSDGACSWSGSAESGMIGTPPQRPFSIRSAPHTPLIVRKAHSILSGTVGLHHLQSATLC